MSKGTRIIHVRENVDDNRRPDPIYVNVNVTNATERIKIAMNKSVYNFLFDQFSTFNFNSHEKKKCINFFPFVG